jgi:hypothetical protein
MKEEYYPEETLLKTKKKENTFPIIIILFPDPIK